MYIYIYILNYSSPVKKSEYVDSNSNHTYDPTWYYFSKFGSNFDQFCQTKFLETQEKVSFEYFSTSQLQVKRLFYDSFK